MQNLPLGDLPTRDVTDAVLGVLQRYTSPTIAQSVLGSRATSANPAE